MVADISSPAAGIMPSRRQLFKTTPALLAAAGAASRPALAQAVSAPPQPQPQAQSRQVPPALCLHGNKIVGYMLAHEQFTVPELVQIGTDASQAGFGALATSDHLQPWQAKKAMPGRPGSR